MINDESFYGRQKEKTKNLKEKLAEIDNLVCQMKFYRKPPCDELNRKLREKILKVCREN